MSDLPGRARDLYDRLVDEYGEPVWRSHGSAMDELVLTMLSANTNDVNSGRAFKRLMATFDADWEAIRTAPLDEIKTAIREAGMYNQKAPNIVKTLTMIKEERGEYRLDFVAEMPAAEAAEYLTRFPGVGHKTASIVLLFCFNGAAFPVDTHVQRISRRVGICGHKTGAAKVKQIWEDLLPPQTYYALHVNLIQHGRRTCDARTPQCEGCCLQDICDYWLQQGDWAQGREL